MGLFDTPQKTFLNAFKRGEWVSEAVRKEDVAAIRASGRIPYKGMIQIIQNYHPSESSRERVIARMKCLEEILEGVKDPTLIQPLLDLLGTVDQDSRTYLIRILKKIYQKELSSFYIDRLKSSNEEIRSAIRDILMEVGGRVVFDLLKEKVMSGALPSYQEAADILAKIAGHHSIDILKHIVSGKRREDRLHALDLLANPRYMRLRKKKALEAVCSQIDDKDPIIRQKVIRILKKHGDKEHVPLLLERLTREERRNLQYVIETLGVIGDATIVEALVPFLENKHSGIKIATIEALGNFDDERCIEPLVEVLRDKNLLIRQRTIEILGEMGRSENIRLGRLLVAMMKDRDVNVRRSVVEVIKIIGDREDIWWKLIRYLRDEDWWVRERVTEILAEMGGEKILEPIISLLDDPSEVVRRYAIEVLSRLGDQRAVEPIMKMLNDSDWWVRESAVEALANLHDPRAVPKLNKLLVEDEEMIWTVLKALQAFGRKSSYIPLLQVLDHPLPEIRLEVVKALDAIGDPKIGETLKALINDDDKRVRDYVLGLLPKYNLTPTGMRRKTYEELGAALLDQILLDVKEKGGEDLFILAGHKPYLKIRGDVEVLDDHVFSSEETERLLLDILSPMQRELFESLNDIDMSYKIKGEGSRFRVNIYRSNTGTSGVFRVINQHIMTLDELKMPKPVYEFTQLKQGLILVTGPTGSGKSTTLAAMIDYMNDTRTDHIVTIEDPIEYVHENRKCIINQREIGAHTLSFSNALKSALREDPDIILVGEMRDLETISIAITAAETGHLVLGTLHTVSAAKTIDRIIDVFPGRQQAQIRAMLSESLKGVLSQQLLKRKDTEGRILVMELMICNESIANLIRKEKIYQIPSILTTSYEQGMLLMDNELMRLLKEGLIYPEDAYIKAINKKEFEPYLTGKQQEDQHAVKGA